MARKKVVKRKPKSIKVYDLPCKSCGLILLSGDGTYMVLKNQRILKHGHYTPNGKTLSEYNIMITKSGKIYNLTSGRLLHNKR